jgi:hypothetical protein
MRMNARGDSDAFPAGHFFTRIASGSSAIRVTGSERHRAFFLAKKFEGAPCFSST